MLLLYTTGATPRVYPVVYSETRSIVVAETEGLILDVQRKVLESEESAILSVWKCAALVHVRLKFGFWLDDGITAKNIVRELYTPPKEPHAWFPLLDGAEFNRLCKESETPFRMSKGQF